MSVKYYADNLDDTHRAAKRLAKDVLVLAALGDMPDSFWLTDSRIKRACKMLGWTPEYAREWAQK